MKSIPVNVPYFEDKDADYVKHCVDIGWVSSAGEYLNLFESKWADFCDRKYGVAVSSGTAALQLAVDALDIPKGKEVIVPTFTIISCILAVLRAGLKPVLVDCDPGTLTMDINQVELAVDYNTAAIMPVHIYGHPVNMEAIIDIAGRNNLHIIEDAAEAHGAEYLLGDRWVKCGSSGTISCFSFYANKIVTTGEGGMVLTNDKHLADRVLSISNLCFQKKRFYHEDFGYNFRMTNMQAALGVAQMERVESILDRKKKMGELYTEILCDIPGIFPLVVEDWAKSVYWMYGIMLDVSSDLDAKSFAEELSKAGVQTRPFFMGMHKQPAFHKVGLFMDKKCPVADNAYNMGLYLPSGVGITENDQLYVCEKIKGILCQ